MLFSDLELPGLCEERLLFARTIITEPFHPVVAARIYLEKTNSIEEVGRAVAALYVSKGVDPSKWLEKLKELCLSFPIGDVVLDKEAIRQIDFALRCKIPDAVDIAIYQVAFVLPIDQIFDVLVEAIKDLGL